MRNLILACFAVLLLTTSRVTLGDTEVTETDKTPSVTEAPKAKDAPAATSWAPVTFNHFGAGFFAGIENSGGQTFTGQVSWFPEWRFSAPWFVRGGVNLSLQKDATAKKFLAASVNALLSYGVDKFEIGAGPGFQTFIDNGGTRFELSGQLSYLIHEKFFIDFERVYVGYTAFLAPSTIHQFVLGAGVAF